MNQEQERLIFNASKTLFQISKDMLNINKEFSDKALLFSDEILKIQETEKVVLCETDKEINELIRKIRND